MTLLALLLLLEAAPTPSLQRQLVRSTQELFDAVAPGNREPWKKYFADDCMYFDEKGRSMDKAALLKDLTPLPSGYSGTIKVENPKILVAGDTAVLSYDLAETETIFGQELTARYHATDTWLRRNGRWQIVAGQVLRYYEDPAPGLADLKKFADYVGTYQLGPERTIAVTADGDRLYAQSGERPQDLLVPEAADIFFRRGIEGRRLFRYGADGKVDALIDRRNNEDVVWKKVR
jgi:hypothetical protein